MQNSVNGKLASDLKRVVQQLKPWTGINLKIVERGGLKLQDLLCKSNCWDNGDCGRIDCFSCDSSARDKEPNFKSCFKRSVVYETLCNTCLTNVSRKLKPDRNHEEAIVKNVSVKSCIKEVRGEAENISDTKTEVENMVKKRKFEKVTEVGLYYRYIGETSRSAYERGGEHQKDLEFRRPKSHLLRHCVEKHPDLLPEKVDFRMKILSTHKSAFERQLREAVVLDYFAGPQIMNSKMEYTRCGIPKLELKI